jgi:hypothetical protein
MKATESTPSKLPTNSGTNSVIPGDKTFNQMTRAEQDSLLMNQAIAEGWKKPTSIQHSHNNPGNIIAPGGKVTPAQAKFGGIPGGTYNGLTFVKFPTMQDGWEAQRDLWTRKYGNQPVSKALATWSDAGKDQGNYNKVALGGGGDSPAPILSSAPTVAATTSPATVASTPSKPAVQIASASTSLADTMRTQMQTPVVINAPTTNNNGVMTEEEKRNRAIMIASIILLSSTSICSLITSPHSGAPTKPVPTLDFDLSKVPTFFGFW